jgi:sugar/nucleoside kinase (ribokinase family)
MVMTVRGTGSRTFFHQRGANALLDFRHFNFSRTRARFFHLGYLLLLDRLDRRIGNHEVVAARLLRAARKAGLCTSVDLVSEDSGRFKDIVRPVLSEVDFLFLNEFEAERCTGRTIRTKRGAIGRTALEKAAANLLRAGVSKCVFIHFAEGAYAAAADGTRCVQGSVKIPSHRTVSTVGAGDAFAAGVLLGLHEDEPLQTCLEYGVCSAGACLLDSTASGGMRPLTECIKLGWRYGFFSH